MVADSGTRVRAAVVGTGLIGGSVLLALHRAGLDVTSCETVTRERRPPHFEVIALIARKPAETTTGRKHADKTTARHAAKKN